MTDPDEDRDIEQEYQDSLETGGDTGNGQWEVDQ